MKTLKTISVLVFLMCCTFYSNAQCTISTAWTYTQVSDTVRFAAADTNTTASHYWSFGDGTVGTGFDALHSYANPGTYHVCLHVYISGTICNDSLCQNIIVGNNTCNASAAFQFAVHSPSVTFYPNTNPTGYRSEWSFGDGTSSHDSVTFQHTYPSSPNSVTYLVCHYENSPTVTSCHDSACFNVTVPGTSPCGVASFSSYLAGTSIHAYSTSTGTDTNSIYTWYIREPSGALVQTQTGRNNYIVSNSLNYGTYYVCLYLSHNTQLCDSSCHNVTVMGCGNAVPNFTISQSGTSVTLQSTSTGAPTGSLYQWWLDGTSVANPSTNTAVTLSNMAAGNHTFCLYIYGPNQTVFCDSTCKSFNVTATNPCAGLNANWGYAILLHDSAHFETQDTNTLANHYWNFGDGSTGSGRTVYHQYATPGTYHVCSYVYIPGIACVDSFCQNITIPNSCNLNAGFQFAVHGDSVTFYPAPNPFGTHSDLVYYYNNTASYDTVPFIHIFPSSPNTVVYHVCRFVYNTIPGCVDSMCVNITIPGTSLLSCGVHPYFNTTILGDTVDFHDYTTVDTAWYLASRKWTFGDGTTDSGTVNPVHIYSASGTYTACEITRGYHLGGIFCSDTFCRSITVTLSTCNITAAYQYIVHTSWVSFYPVANSPNLLVYNRWTFGDGTDSVYTTNITWLTHSYPQNPNAVTYHVCHYVYLGGTNCVDSVCQYVVVPGTTVHCGVASFTAYTLNGTIHAGSTSTGVDSNTYYNWYIWSPNGVLIQSQSSHTSYIVSPAVPPGIYQVCLFLYGANQTFCDSTCQNIGVTSINPCSGLNAQWVYGLLPNDSAHFETRDTNTTANHYWNFGDGSTGSGRSVYHHYTSPGTYNVCSYVYIPGISCVDSFCQTITVTGNQCSGLNAQWTQTYNTNGSVLFTGVTSSNVTQNHWDFGDGTSSNLFDPTHCYSTAGLYTVCHIVSIPGTICADTSCMAIQANTCNPCSGFTINIGAGANQIGGYTLEAYFPNGTPPNTLISYHWSTGDTARVITVAHTGVYCVTVSNNNGCTATACDSVLVSPTACVASFNWHFINCNTVEFGNTSLGNNLHYQWYYGNGIIDTASAPHHTFPVGTWSVTLTIYNTATNCQSSYTSVITVQPCGGVNDTLCGYVFNDLNNNGILDVGETGINNTLVYIDSISVHTDSAGHYLAIVPTGSHYLHVTVPTGCTLTIPLGQNNIGGNYGGYYHTPVFTYGGPHCGYNFGINCSIVHVCGTVFLDANNNGIQDSTETGIANVGIVITGSNGVVHHAYTDQFGNYCETLPIGTYTVTTTPTVYPGGVVTPQSITVNATISGTTYGGNNFAVYVQPGSCDLSIEITPHTTITAGYPAWYSIQVCNIGANISDGEVNLFYDPAIAFDHSSPSQTSQNSSTHTVTWDFTNLLPGHCLYYWVVFNADSQIAVNQFVFTLASITPGSSCNDINMVNNVDTVHQAVTASWDPNNKFAYKTNYAPNPNYHWVSSIDADQRLQYVINFQNTGNAPAVNIVVKDTVTSDLDLNSFELLGMSHPCVMTSNGTELNFKFSNIMLPPSSQDEPNSHGWIKFAMNSVNGLPGGHVITDPAEIYFDYNSPVTTNNADVIMLDASGINEVVNNVTVVIAPNPMSEFTNITLNNSQADNFLFIVTDLTGRTVAQKNSTGNTLQFNRQSLAAGLYTYQIIQNNKVVAKGKLVMQ